MSKQLKEEYKKLKQQEIPDLWNRIETALPEKNLSIYSEQNNEITKIKKVTIFTGKKAMYYYGGILVACVCVFVMIPILKQINYNEIFSNKNKIKSDTQIRQDMSKSEISADSSKGYESSDNEIADVNGGVKQPPIDWQEEMGNLVPKETEDSSNNKIGAYDKNMTIKIIEILEQDGTFYQYKAIVMNENSEFLEENTIILESINLQLMEQNATYFIEINQADEQLEDGKFNILNIFDKLS